MPIYIYRAVTKNGQLVRNRVEEINRFVLLKKLKNNQLLPISVVQINARGYKTIKRKKRNIETNDSVLKSLRDQELEKNLLTRGQRLKNKIKKTLFSNIKILPRDIIIFTQNLYLLKKANFNNIQALATIIESTENASLKAIIEDILVGVESGDNMYTTMEYYTGVFSPIYINMIKVGEISGSLTRALEQAVKYLDDNVAITKKLKDILIPNLIQFVVLLVLLVVGTLISIPAIQSMFEQVGTEQQLPGITLAFAAFLDNVVKFWYIPVSIIAAIVISIFVYIRTPRGRYNFDYFKYKMPVFGKLIYLIDFSRLIKAILLNIRNGMRIQESLETSKNISHNLVMLSIVESSINNILIGQSWIEPFEESGLASPMIIEMLKIGMQTDIQEMMEKLLDYVDFDINNSIQKVIKVLPQIIYIIVGVLLIFVTLVVLVPLIQVYMGSWLFSAYL